VFLVHITILAAQQTIAMKRLLLFCAVLCGTFVSHAQLLTWTPPFPKENDPSQTLVITADATKGNQGLLNYTPTSDVYVHIGAVTNKSNGGWVNVPFTWATTPTAARATYIGNNKWTFTITGSLRSFFNVQGPDTIIQKIGILFRSGNGNNVLRNADGSDMFVPVYGNNLTVRIDQPAREPKFIPTPEPQTWSVGTNVTINAKSNNNATLTLFFNGTQIATASNAQTITGNATVMATGNQQIVARATDGTTTTSDTINVFVAGTAPVAPLPAGVQDGINYAPGNTSATLVLRAPGKNLVTVIGEFNNWTQTNAYTMNKTPDGKFFWLTITGLTPGVEYAYQYVVDGTLKIADPYAEKILDPNNDQFIPASTFPNLKPYPAGQTGIVSVLQTAAPAYNWRINNFNRPDKRGIVAYELLVRDFVNAQNWKTVQDSLNYLKTLGINAIELMPFNEFEGNISWGYNPSFYFAPDKYYGTKNAFKEFIDSCHSKGIAVIMDIALNHSFGQSPMVQLYWDAANNRPAANNPWFNPVAKHAFNVGYDMNHESLDTRYFTSRVLEHWVKEYKLDGYRFDLSKGFTQVQTCDANGNNCNVGNWGNYDATRVAIWKRYYDTLQLKGPGTYAILEHFADNNEEKELAEYGMLFWGNMNHNYSQAAKGNSSDWNLSGAIHTARTWTRPHLMSYMESHDEERVTFRVLNEGNASGSYNTRDTATALKRMELAAAFLFTIPGPKMIWQFGELGYHYSINTCTNGTINNNCRLDPKPIRWDFLNDNRRRSVYNTYSKLLQLRQHPWYKEAFLSGVITYDLGGAGKMLQVSSGDSSRLVVIGNFDVNATNVNVLFPTPGTWYDYFNNTTFTATGGTQSILLTPGQFFVYVNRNVNNVATTPVSNLPAGVAALEAKLFPNPASAQANLQFRLPSAGSTLIELYNSFGQKINVLRNGVLPAGLHNLPLQTKSLPKGVYYLRINSKAGNAVLSLHIQ
jgi:1,4-alpha-glucan branching enzyme